jgi:hypothetical protein
MDNVALKVDSQMSYGKSAARNMQHLSRIVRLQQADGDLEKFPFSSKLGNMNNEVLELRSIKLCMEIDYGQSY